MVIGGFNGSEATDSRERPLYTVSGKGSAEYKTVEAYNEYLSDVKSGLIEKNGVKVTLENCGLTFPYKVKDDGVYEDVSGVVVSLKPNAKVQFNKVINLADFSKYDPIISLSCLPGQVGYLDMKRINVKIIDIYNPDNYLIIKVKEHEVGDGDYIGYTMVSVCGEDNECTYYSKYPRLVYGKDAHFSFKGRPGLSAKGKVVYESELSRAGEFLSFYYDNDYGVVYQKDYSGTFSLLCDTKAAASFEGFTTGEVVVEVYADKYVGASANFVVKDFAGLDLSNNSTDDIGPIIWVDCDENNVTMGKAGYKYPFYEAKAIDKFNGETDVGTIVYKNYYSDNASVIETDGDGFVPDSEGVYTICYFASDSYGDVSEKTVDVKVVSDGFDLNIALENKIEAALQGDKVTLADVKSSGGLGEISYTVSVVNHDKNVEISDNAFIPLNVGEYTVTYTVKDFIEQTKTESYTVRVSGNSKPIIADDLNSKLDKRYVLGNGSVNYAYPLQTVYAYTFTDDGYEKVETEISTDNGTVKNGVYTPEREGAVNFYFSYNGVVVGSATRNVYGVTKTVDGVEELDINKMFLSVGNIESGYADSAAARYLVKDDSAYLEYLNSLIAEDFSFDFLTETGYNSIGKVNLYLTDENNSEQSVKLTFTKSAQEAYFSINDGSLSEIDGAFSGDTKDVFKVSLRTTTQSVVVCGKTFTVVNYLSGKSFSGFDSYKINLRITFENVGDAGFVFIVKNLSAQAFNSSVIKDTTKPIIKFFGEDGGLKERGDKVTLPVAIASDVLSPTLKNFSLTVTNGGNAVKDVTGKELFNVNPAQYEITLENYGEYVFSYTATDYSGRSQTATFVIYVYDLVAPVVEIDENSKATSCNVNEKVGVAGITVSDNTCSVDDITVNVFVKAQDSAPVLIKNNEFVPDKAGVYTVYYYVYDAIGGGTQYSQGSVTVLSYTITVK